MKRTTMQYKNSFSHNLTVVTAGMTLPELLIGIIITALVLFSLAFLTMSTGRNTTRLSANAELVKEGQMAQQLIAGRISEAIYIWAPGSTTDIQLGNGETTKNTITGGNTPVWSIGRNSYFEDEINKIPRSLPILAMVLPPSKPTYDANGDISNCNDIDSTSLLSGDTTQTNASTRTDGCYRLFAYYPVRRSFLVNARLQPFEKPPANNFNDKPNDPANDRWVLMEFRANLYKGVGSGGAWNPGYVAGNRTEGVTLAQIGMTTLRPFFAGRHGNLLLDYIKPNSLSFRIFRPGSPDTNGRTDPTIQDASGKSVVNTNNGRVEFEFDLERLLSDDLNGPKAFVPIKGSTTVKNWYCPKAIKTTPNFDYNCP